MKREVHMHLKSAILGWWLAVWLVVSPGVGRALAAQPGTETSPARVEEPAVERSAGAETSPVVEGRTTESAAPAEPRAAVEPMHLDKAVSVGGEVRVGRGQIADGVVVVRGDAFIEGDVEGDVVVVLGRVQVTGNVRGDVVVVMGEADVNGQVRGDLVMVLTRGRLGPSANIRGHTAAIGVPPLIEEGAKVRGRPEIINLGPLVGYVDRGKDYLFEGVFLLRPFPPGLGWVWVVCGFFLGFHLLITLFFPGAVRDCIQTLHEAPARSFLIGLLTCVLVGPLSVLLGFTVVAVPLIWLAYLLLCVFGRVAVYGAAGAGVLRMRGEAISPFLSVLVGSVLFYASYMVPFLGFFVYWIVLPWGVGAALIRLSESLRRERREPPVGTGWRSSGGLGVGAAQAIAAGRPGPATDAIVEPPASAAEVPPSMGTPGLGSGVGSGVGSGSGSAGVGGAFAGQGTARSAAGGSRTLNPIELAALPRVGFWPRLGAVLIDITLVAVMNGVVFDGVKTFWLLLAVYHFALWSWKGTTLGGSALGLRLIRVDGRELDWQTCAFRVLGGMVSLLVAGLGFVWVAWDAECQSWHDRIAGTTIIKADLKSAMV